MKRTQQISRVFVCLAVALMLAATMVGLRDYLQRYVVLYGRITDWSADDRLGFVILVDGYEYIRSHPVRGNDSSYVKVKMPNGFGFSVDPFEEFAPSLNWGELAVGEVGTIVAPDQRIIHLVPMVAGFDAQCVWEVDNSNLLCVDGASRVNVAAYRFPSMVSYTLVVFSAVAASLAGATEAANTYMNKRHRSSRPGPASSDAPPSPSLLLLIASVFSLTILFGSVIILLTWAATQVSRPTYLIILAFALPFLLILLVVQLRILGLITPNQVMRFLAAIERRVPTVDLGPIASLLERVPSLAGSQRSGKGNNKPDRAD